jgi:hypothetical protein
VICGADGVINRLQANDKAHTVMMLKTIRNRDFIVFSMKVGEKWCLL